VEEYKERVQAGECSGNVRTSWMKMEKWHLLKLFQEWEDGR
jgi:hypothetical protein